MSEQMPFILRDLGRVPYDEAFALQRQLQAEVISWRDDADPNARPIGHLLLLEHDPPVITISRRKGARQHLVATDDMLRRAGVTVAETDRGGDITYHGPGQLVGYPILDLNRLGLRLHSYMRFLEDVIIDTLATFGIVGMRDAEATGVWVKPRHQGIEAMRHQDRMADEAHAAAKICAMGVRVSRWVSMHGFALNVTTNLDHFNLIVPCGLIGRGVTSVERELGEDCPSMETVKGTMAESFTSRVNVIAAQAARERAAST